MAINGIISGFADATNPTRHLALIGTGQSYFLIRHGRPVCRLPDLVDAQTKFDDEARLVCSENWRNILGTKTDSLGNTTVTDLGINTFAAVAQQQ